MARNLGVHIDPAGRHVAATVSKKRGDQLSWISNQDYDIVFRGQSPFGTPQYRVTAGKPEPSGAVDPGTVTKQFYKYDIVDLNGNVLADPYVYVED